MRLLGCPLMVALAALQKADARQLASMFDDSAVPSPLQRVVTLLNSMKEQLYKEGEDETKLHDKMACWCETNEKEKKQAISDADALISQLESEVESRSARHGTLSTEIEHLKQELAEQKEALKKLIEIREQDQAEFRSSEKELVQNIASVKNAIVVLGKHNAGLLQFTPAMEASVNSVLQAASLLVTERLTMATRHGRRSRGAGVDGDVPKPSSLLQSDAKFSATDKAVLRSPVDGRRPAVDVPVEYAARVLATAAGGTTLASFAQQPFYKSYSSASGQIFGVLKQLQENLEGNLSQEQKDEIAAQESFEQVKASSEEQIAAGTARLDDMEDEHSQNTKGLSDAKEDLENTRSTRSSDVKFVEDLNLKCQEIDHEYSTRVKARNEEIKAVTDTIGILTSDDNRAALQKAEGAINFLQTRAQNSAHALARNRASAVLMQAARQQHGTGQRQMAALAVQVRIDEFTKVKEAIDTMISQMKTQQDEEVKKKTFCNDELNQNEKDSYNTEQDLKAIRSKYASLMDTIEKLTQAIDEDNTRIAAIEIDLKKASEQRHQENVVFQQEVTDQRTMQNILAKAVDRLRAVYKNAAFAQSQITMGQTPPGGGFQPARQNAGASPVIGLIEQVIEDSKKMEQDLHAGEHTAQQAYETLVTDTDAMLTDLHATVDSNTMNKAQAEEDKSHAEEQQAASEEQLDGLHEYKSDLHDQCDFVLRNFDNRQKARLEEIEAMQKAKSFLSGMRD